MISSSQNNKIKTVRSLQTRPKHRRDSDLVLCEGVRLAEEAYQSGWTCEYVLHVAGLSARAGAVRDAFRQRGDAVEEVPESLFREMSDTETSQGILAVLKKQKLAPPASADFFLIPAQIRDPGNLGTLLRTAAAAGVSAVFLPPDTADAFAPKVMRAGMGAHFHVPILTLRWDEISTRISSVPGMRTFLAAAGLGRAYYREDFLAPLTLMIGGEAEGAPEEAKQLVDAFVQIPMPGGFESLNAAVAGAILLYEVIRQRNEGR